MGKTTQNDIKQVLRRTGRDTGGIERQTDRQTDRESEANTTFYMFSIGKLDRISYGELNLQELRYR